MNNECNSELKMCRFCQQFMMCDEDGTAESVCMCDGAIKERNRQMAAADLLASVNKCCGEGGLKKCLRSEWATARTWKARCADSRESAPATGSSEISVKKSSTKSLP